LSKGENNGITLLTFNRKTIYTYSATGSNLTTELWVNGSLSKTTEYSGAFVYEDGQLSYINIPDGRYVVATGKYEYNLTDNLGNVRVTFTKDLNGSAKIIQEDHYYPFGLQMSGMHYENTALFTWLASINIKY
jgi:hypothetical protein